MIQEARTKLLFPEAPGKSEYQLLIWWALHPSSPQPAHLSLQQSGGRLTLLSPTLHLLFLTSPVIYSPL